MFKIATRLYSFILCLTAFGMYAQTSKPDLNKQLLSNCAPATAQADLDINNVRATILNGGDLWWDLNDGKYEIPKGSGRVSMFCGALWIGGVDAGGQIHSAGQTYRQTGNDFWPGPIDSVTLTTNASTCLNYDKVYKVNRSQVEYFIAHHNDPGYVIPDYILNWPAIAPFTDVNGDAVYNPLDGDYPAYAQNTASQNCQYNLLGDQTLWWVFNDVGNLHTESGAQAMGVEIHAQAFAYSTYDEINDMTFYQYKIINRSSNTYNNTRVGMYVDTDLGSANDDYIGSDVSRGLAYSFNGDAVDDNPPAGQIPYGPHPPAIGIDVIGGPLADPGDGIDNDRDSILDEPGERIAMSHFIYIDGYPPWDGPISPDDMYNYMGGINQFGNHLTYGGTGTWGTINCNFFFPGDSDPNGWATGGIPQPAWSESSIGNIPADRRFVFGASQFTFEPGEVQSMTNVVVWAQDTNSAGDNLTSLAKLKLVDDKAQALFDNCFQIACVPPNAVILETHNELTVQFSYPNAGNTFHWDFGDCGYHVSSERNPSHTFCKPGTYEVCLTVSNECGSDQICVPLTVSFHRPGVQLKRIEGTGNGGNYLDFASGMHDSVMSSASHRVFQPVYDYSAGPVKIEVLDKNLLPQDIFTIRLDSVTTSSGWMMYRAGAPDTVFSDTTITVGNVQLVPQWGLSVQVKQWNDPGIVDHFTTPRNGAISGSKTYADDSRRWLDGVEDTDSIRVDNWIRSGKKYYSDPEYNDYPSIDIYEEYEDILNGTWAPYRLCAYTTSLSGGIYEPAGAPAWKTNLSLNQLKNVSSVDIVLTSDPSKWTRSPVVELQDDPLLAVGGRKKLHLRDAPSVDKTGAPDGTGNGMGWFPGYAINVETGERLNIMFGEDSFLPTENGRDMIWNPTSSKFSPSGDPIFGGKHYIYVMGHNGNNVYSADPLMGNGLRDVPLYDEGIAIKALLDAAQAASPPSTSDIYKREVYADVMWVGMPLLASGQSLLSNEVRIKLRVTKSYKKYATLSPSQNNDFPMYEFDGRNINNPGGEMITVEEGEVLVYPNPFATFSTIQFSNEQCGRHTLDMYDIQGKLIRRYENIVSDRVLIDRQGLRSGMYFYYLKNADEKIATGKLMIK